MKFGVVVFPGSNCDRDAEYAVKTMGHDCEMLWHKDTSLKEVDCVILPGGFSYGDYLRAGAIARFSPIMEEVVKFAKDGGLVIGICNGFQVLTEAGLLPGSLNKNTSLKFNCDITPVKVENCHTPFTIGLKKDEVLHLPVAHGEGNYYIDQDGLQELIENGQIVFRYQNNPNGSVGDIAGIVNKERNVLGMMPHPERAVESYLGSEDGVKMFQSIIKWWGDNNGSKI